MKPALRPAIVYDLNGTLARQMPSEGKTLYRKHLADALSVLDSAAASDLAAALGVSVKQAAELKEATGSKGGLAKALAGFCSNPPRGSTARTVYYKALYAAKAVGELSPQAIDGAKTQLEKTRRQGFANIAFSRGPEYFLKHLVEATGLLPLLDEIYSTDEFGFDKKKGTYAALKTVLAQRGYRVERVYEDELEAAQAATDDGLECFLVTDGRFGEAKKMEKR
ncbi:MAG: hypothetical protein AB1626_01600 [Candidatus Micrarchaeota archaeon]